MAHSQAVHVAWAGLRDANRGRMPERLGDDHEVLPASAVNLLEGPTRGGVAPARQELGGLARIELHGKSRAAHAGSVEGGDLRPLLERWLDAPLELREGGNEEQSGSHSPRSFPFEPLTVQPAMLTAQQSSSVAMNARSA